MRNVFAALILTVYSLIFASSTQAELSIQITQGVDNPIPIAVVPFSWEGSGVLSEDVGQIVINDLEQVGEFRALSRSNMLSMPSEEREVFFNDWRVRYILSILALTAQVYCFLHEVA